MRKSIIGIYSISNTVNNKCYIGSSTDIARRFKTHLNMLKNNKHINSHLQAAVNKYGLNNFTFSILQECSQDEIIEKEQFYIDSFDWNQLYNKARTVYTGGSNLVEIPIYLLNLKGVIIHEYKSGAELARDLNIPLAPYYSFNTSSILKTKFRIVSVDFYLNNLDVIKTWRQYSNESEYKKSLKQIQYKYYATKEEEIHHFFKLQELGDFLGITKQAVQQILTKHVNKIHKSTGYLLGYVKSNI